MHIIFGNYGNNTIAVMQWVYNENLKDVIVVHVETGSAVSVWQQRVEQGQRLAQKYLFKVHTLTADRSFSDLVKDRRSFPSVKYQWCPTFLKALPLLTWLDQIDERAEAVIILGSRRADSRARLQLPSVVAESEYYNDRKVWYPLCHHSDLARNELIDQAGFEVLNHRSLECDPCIHNQKNDFVRLEQETIRRVLWLEEEVNEPMFHARFPDQNITQVVALAHEHADLDEVTDFDFGCGSHYACGE